MITTSGKRTVIEIKLKGFWNTQENIRMLFSKDVVRRPGTPVDYLVSGMIVLSVEAWAASCRLPR
jgi:hypothetical protein